MSRPRKFDESTVLDLALDVFWRQGFEGASMTTLAKAMGMNPPSIYGAFGSKKGLYSAVLHRYELRQAEFARWTVAGPSSQAVAERLLLGAVDGFSTENALTGCLLVQAGLSATCDIPVEPAYRRSPFEILLAERFQSAADLPAGCDVAELAQYLHMVFRGLAVIAARGAPREQLRAAAARALIGFMATASLPPAPVQATEDQPP